MRDGASKAVVAERAANHATSARLPRNTAPAGMPPSSAPVGASSLPSPSASALPSSSSSTTRALDQAAARASGSSRSASARSSAPSTNANGAGVVIAWPSDGERRAAPAGRLRVRVADHELRAMQALGVVDLGAHQVLQAQRIDQQGHAVGGDRQVVLALRFVELEAVLEARAAAALDVDAQLERVVAFLGHELADLRGCGG